MTSRFFLPVFFVAVFCSVSLVSVSVSAPAYALPGWVEFFFPSLKEDVPGPEDTLRAPFSDAPETAEKEVELPVNAVPLARPHRVSSELTQWVMDSAAQVMNFDVSQDYRVQLKAHGAFFDESGRGQHAKFLNDANVFKVLKTGNFHVRSYVEDLPLLLNQGNVQGRYRWLYQVDFVISYIDKDATGYNNTKPVNQRAKVNLQIGRSNDAPNDAGVLIETWSGAIEAFEGGK